MNRKRYCHIAKRTGRVREDYVGKRVAYTVRNVAPLPA